MSKILDLRQQIRAGLLVIQHHWDTDCVFSHPEMEMVPPSTGSSGGEGDSTTTRVHKTKSESSTSNKS